MMSPSVHFSTFETQGLSANLKLSLLAELVDQLSLMVGQMGTVMPNFDTQVLGIRTQFLVLV